MPETKQLRIFKTIVEVGSFTGAAARLGLSQPAISQQVRALEEALGVSLLVRVGRGTRPTPAGAILLDCARKVLERLDELRAALAEQAHGRAGLVRLGLPEPPCNYVLPPVLVELVTRFPRIDVRVTSGHTAATLGRLNAGELDLALLPLPVDPGRLRVTEIGRDELVAIVPPEHPWAVLPWIGAQDFAEQPIVVYDRTSQITDLTLGFLLGEGVFPRIAVEIDHIEAIKELVRAGVGAAVVPAWSARRELTAGVLRASRLGARGLTRAWGVLHRGDRRLAPALRACVQLLADLLPALLAVDLGGGRPEAPAERLV